MLIHDSRAHSYALDVLPNDASRPNLPHSPVNCLLIGGRLRCRQSDSLSRPAQAASIYALIGAPSPAACTGISAAHPSTVIDFVQSRKKSPRTPARQDLHGHTTNRRRELVPRNPCKYPSQLLRLRKKRTAAMTTQVNFVTGNANKLREVKAILEPAIEVRSSPLDLEEIQGSIEEVTESKCRRAAEAVCFHPNIPSPFPANARFMGNICVIQRRMRLTIRRATCRSTAPY